MKRLWRVIAWIRFRGWANVYWREDWYESRCDHSDPHTITTGTANYTDVFTMCVSCGAVLHEG